MALPKANLNIPFGQGLDTKTDPKQVQPGKMLSLVNSVFEAGNLLQKRNGFQQLSTIPVTDTTSMTTFGGSLAAVGAALYNYAPENDVWYNKGKITSVDTVTVPLVRSSTGQTAQDVAIEPEGLACSVWSDSSGSYKYQINDSTSSQIIVSATNLPATATQARVFILDKYFIITFLATVAAATHLQFIAIPIASPTSPGAATDVGLTVTSLTAGYDGCVSNDALYLAWSDIAPEIKLTYITSQLVVAASASIATRQATYMAVTADMTTPTPIIWLAFWDGTNNNLYGSAYSTTLNPVLAPTVIVNSANINKVTAVATSGVMTALYQSTNTYSYTPNARTDFISRQTVTQLGVVSAASIVLRSVGLASKAFYLDSTIYFMAAYGGAYQPTYFLTDSLGNLSAKLAYSNGGGYTATQVLPGVNLLDNVASIGYLFKDLLTSVNKDQGSANVNGIYSQTGINYVSWSIGNGVMQDAEVGNNLHLGGGFPWMYDGTLPVEHGFHVWPEDVTAVWSATGGSMAARPDGMTNTNAYFYQVTYEWTDAWGNIHRSAPSVPVAVTTTGVASTGSVTLNIPTLRLTYKTANSKVRLVIYRWSIGQQNYYQVTSIASPTNNDPSVDSIAYVDTLADSSILGNQLIYTTGGVIENIAGPAVADFTLFKSRLIILDAEDRNLLWYSKQVIQQTPAETSDLFTIYVAPTAGAQGSTGDTTAISAMDDKLIIFKRNAIYYLTGNGPDNTGAQNDFSEPTYITSTAGCINPNSVVFMPQGLMFQSDKGIWLLSRDLSTNYIGAPVERYNDVEVLSALNIPGTNQVRFTLANGITLMYDYYYGQWGTFTGIPAVDSTLFEDLHTYVDQYGRVFQESPGTYVDGSIPVNMSFTTGWMNLAGLQGLERAYFFYLLGTYISPHKLKVDISYDYNPNPSQSMIISPDNYAPNYGDEDGPYGSGQYGGSETKEQWRIFLEKQKLQAFQISITESYDSTKGAPAGAGLTLSGINLVVSQKKGYVPIRAANSTG